MSGGEQPTETFGPYLVYEELGIGGMAQVHRAEATGIEGFRRQVALKRMLPHLARDEDFVRSFVREARLASHLRHNNVAQTYELGKVGDIYFIAMELVSGPDLRQVLRHCVQATGPMPVPITLNILGQICEALDYAHNLSDESGQPLGIIHRDVSPSNIIVAEGGVVKLIDFGIAKASAAGMQTMSGAIKGKFGYMAPEYIAGTIDARADLFAVGVIAHELLTSRPLFSGRDDIETLHRLRALEVDPPSKKNPAVPREVDDIVMTALARDPDRRWHQAHALRNALATVTRRLTLIATNQQVSDHITWAFEQTGKAPGSSRGQRNDTEVEDDDEDLSISLEHGTAVLPESSVAVPVGNTSILDERMAHADDDDDRSPLATMVDAPRQPAPMPIGTPSAMTAQRSIPPTNADPSAPGYGGAAGSDAPEYLDGPSGLTEDGERRRASARHNALVPSASRRSDPAVLYESAPTKQRMGTTAGAGPATPVLPAPPAERTSNPALSLAGLSHPGTPMAKKSTEFGVAPAWSTPATSRPAMVPATPSSSGSITNVVGTPTSGQHPAQHQSGPIPRQSGAIDAPVHDHTQPVVSLPAPGAPPVKKSRVGFIVLVLIAAIAAAAVVYFALPALTK
jgi:serine/threonine protein kinase